MDADSRTVHQVVPDGALGEVLLFESRMEQPPQPEGFPVTGGGALLHLGSHAVDQALHLSGTLVVPDDDGQTRAADGRPDTRDGGSRAGHGLREPVRQHPPRRRRPVPS